MGEARGSGIRTSSSPKPAGVRAGSPPAPSSMRGLETLATALPTLGLVAVAVALSLYERLDLEGDIGVAVIRSFLQLAAMGYAIDYVFGLESLVAVSALLTGMVLFAAWTSSRRAGGVPRAF